MRAPIAIATLVVAAALAAATPASADRYAAPDGTGTACTQQAPCALDQALSASEVVWAAPGEYGPYSSSALFAVDLRGTDRTDPPLIRMRDQMLAGAIMRDVRVERTGTPGPVVGRQTASPITLERVTVVNRTTGDGVKATAVDAVDSALAAPGGSAVLIEGDAVSGTLRNVTAHGDTGLGVNKTVATGTSDVTVVNSILEGTGFDLAVQGTGLTVHVSYANYETTASAFATVDEGAGNQEGQPLLAGAPDGDATPLAGSPTIDAGNPAAVHGAEAWLAFPRVLGAAPDIGAGEYAPPPAVTTGAVTDIAATSAVLHADADGMGLPGTVVFEYGTASAYGATTGPQAAGTGLSAAVGGLSPATTYVYRAVVSTRAGTVQGAERSFTTAPAPGAAPDTTAPVVSALSLTRRRFRVGPGVTPTSATKRGTALLYSLSEPATAAFAIQRALRGRRRAGRCRTGGRKGRRCTRWKTVGTLTRPSGVGSNRLVFTGRFGSRGASTRLKAGRHRFVLVATDAAGNASKPKRIGFRVTRR